MSKSPNSRVRSVRALLALGGAAAVMAGSLAGTDSLAASTDSATAQVSQIASENFFPAPVASDMRCERQGANGTVWTRLRLSWTAPEGFTGLTYVVEGWQNNTSKIWEDATSVPEYAGIDPKNGATTRYRVRTKNAQGELSQGYISYEVKSGVTDIMSCERQFGPENVATWQEGTTYRPAARQVVTGRSGADAKYSDTERSTETSPSTTAPSTAPSSALNSPAPTSSSSSSSASSSSVPSSAASSSSAPSAGVPSPSATAEPKITFGVGVSGGERVLLIYRDGGEVCHTPLAEGDQPSINGGTVVVQNGDTVKNVDTSTCALS